MIQNLVTMCPIEIEIKDTQATVKSDSYLDVHLANVNPGKLKKKLYSKTLRQNR